MYVLLFLLKEESYFAFISNICKNLVLLANYVQKTIKVVILKGVNSLWPSDAYMPQYTRPSLAELMKSHYLNHCWNIGNRFQWNLNQNITTNFDMSSAKWQPFSLDLNVFIWRDFKGILPLPRRSRSASCSFKAIHNYNSETVSTNLTEKC